MLSERYRIGGFGIALRSTGREPYHAARPAFACFVDASNPERNGPIDIEIVARIGDIPAHEAKSGERWKNTRLWSAERTGEGWAFDCLADKPQTGRWRLAKANPSITEVEITSVAKPAFLPAGASLPHPLDFPLAELLLLHKLAGCSGMLVHGCAIVDDGRGYLLCGRSGAGKSTSAGIWQHEALVLNDDRVIVRKEGDAFFVYGTPWHGDFAKVSPVRAPLCGVYFIEHADTTQVRALLPAQVHARMLASCWLPLWDKDDAAPATMATCAAMVAQVSCQALAFRPDRSIIEAVRECEAFH